MQRGDQAAGAPRPGRAAAEQTPLARGGRHTPHVHTRLRSGSGGPQAQHVGQTAVSVSRGRSLLQQVRPPGPPPWDRQDLHVAATPRQTATRDWPGQRSIPAAAAGHAAGRRGRGRRRFRSIILRSPSAAAASAARSSMRQHADTGARTGQAAENGCRSSRRAGRREAKKAVPSARALAAADSAHSGPTQSLGGGAQHEDSTGWADVASCLRSTVTLLLA